MRTILLISIAVCFVTNSNADYSDSKKLNEILNTQASRHKTQDCPKILSSKIIGKSAAGTPIYKYVFDIQKITTSDLSEAERSRLQYKKVKVLLMGNIHGNEISGRQLLKKLVESFQNLICNKKLEKEKPNTFKIVKNLLQEMVLTIIPSVNPDGFDKRLGYKNCCKNGELKDHCISSSRSFVEGKREMREHDKLCRDFQNSKLTQKLWTVGRYAKNTKTQKQNVDMNRDFPDLSQIYFDDESALFDQSKINKTMATNSENNQHEYFQAQESRVLKGLFEKENFDYTISYHDGAQVVSYGLDKALGRFGVEPRDIDLFKKLSENYASHIMEGCQSEYGNQFKTGRNGITNGAEWYSIAGTSTDYQYIKYGTIPLTIEMSCNKFSSKTEIERKGGLLDSHEDATIDFLLSIIRPVPEKARKAYTKLTPTQTKSRILLVGNSKVLESCKNGTCKQKRVFFEHVESKVYYNTVSDKYGRFRKPLLNHGSYKVSVRDVKFTQAKKSDKVEFTFGYDSNQLLNMGTFMDLGILNEKSWKKLEKKFKRG